MKHYLGIALAVLTAIPCFGQQATQPTPAISGKDHPELIDDATAYWHLFSVLSRSSGESDEMFQRRRMAFANKAGLTPPQVTLLLAAADKFSQQMAAFNNLPATAENHGARTNAVLDIVAALHQELGSYASSILTNHVNTDVKKTIVMVQPKTVGGTN